MRIPITRYGLPQVVVIPGLIAVLAVVLYFVWPGGAPWAQMVGGLMIAGVLAFFRDPHRQVPPDAEVLVSPADGKITDIGPVEDCEYLGGPARRIGIFLSIFDTHINRAPCNVKVENTAYKKGLYKNAKNPYSGRVNESNDLYLARTESPEDKLIVRQISGAIARRIVCHAQQGQELSGGEKFGMIKFGSRTELYVPASQNAKCCRARQSLVSASVCTVPNFYDFWAKIRDLRFSH